MSLSSVERAARDIHAAFTGGASLPSTLARYDDLIQHHPKDKADILSVRAYTWTHAEKPERAIGDLLFAVDRRSAGRLAADLNYLSGLFMELHRFVEAETALAQLIEVERAEHSTYFVEHAFLMRAYCLACVGRGNEAVLLLDHVAPDASWDYTDNLPDITPDLIRSLAKSTR